MLPTDWIAYAAAFVGALLAGGINTIAGNGSSITLSVLTEICGLPGNTANGTNRIGVVAQGFSATIAYSRKGMMPLKEYLWQWVVMISGALLGIGLALLVTDDQFRTVFRYMMGLMLLLILFKPERWLKPQQSGAPLSRWIVGPLLFINGIYGGFIQMGMGLFFLGIMVLAAKVPLTPSNALKIWVTLVFNAVALLAFAWVGKIHWGLGLTMALGQSLGAWWMAQFSLKHPKAEVWVYRALVVIVIISLASLMGLFRLR